MAGYLSLENYIRVKTVNTRDGMTIQNHTRIACEAIELMVADALPDGKKNLLLVFPPRFGKTHLVRSAIEWATGILPDCEWIYSSWGARLAADQTEAIRDVMGSPWYRELFPRCQLKSRAGKGARDHFKTTRGGVVYASGAKGGIVGFGAGKRRKGFGGAFVIDDPITPQDARYAVKRETCRNFYTQSAKPRRNRGDDTPVLFIAQRLNPDDLVAYIEANEADLWHIVRIPAQLEDGSATYPEAISAETLNTMKVVDKETYYTQYQGVPIQPGGSILQEEWWHYFEDWNEVRRRITHYMIFGDTAQKKGVRNDKTAFHLWGYEGGKRAYLMDRIAGKWEFPELVEMAKMFWAKHSNPTMGTTPAAFWIEDKVSGTGLIQTLRREKIKVQEWSPALIDMKEDDKVSRARASAWHIYGGHVWLPSSDLVPWVDPFVNQCSSFTSDDSHPEDDDVDAMTMAICTWASMGGGYRQGA